MRCTSLSSQSVEVGEHLFKVIFKPQSWQLLAQNKIAIEFFIPYQAKSLYREMRNTNFAECGGGGGHARFDLEYNQTVVLDAKEATATTPEILATHCIPSAMSKNIADALQVEQKSK